MLIVNMEFWEVFAFAVQEVMAILMKDVVRKNKTLVLKRLVAKELNVDKH